MGWDEGCKSKSKQKLEQTCSYPSLSSEAANVAVNRQPCMSRGQVQNAFAPFIDTLRSRQMAHHFTIE